MKQQLQEAEYRLFQEVMWLFRRRWDDLEPEEPACLKRLVRHAPNLKRVHQFRGHLREQL